MDIGTSFVPNAQPAQTLQPSERSLDDPMPFPKALTGFDTAPANLRGDATLQSQIRLHL